MAILEEESPTTHKRIHFVVREMEIDDLAPVFHLGEKLFTAREVPNLYRSWDEYEVVQFFQSEGEYCLVAETDDQLIGFAMGTTVEKSRSAWKYGHLVWLGVAPEFHHCGVGARLFAHFLDLMDRAGVRILLTDTEADNEPAMHFFQKMGFGQLQEHVYLSLNLASHKRAERANHHSEAK